MNDHDAVGRGRGQSQIVDDEEHGEAVVGQLAQEAGDVDRGAEVELGGRLGGDQGRRPLGRPIAICTRCSSRPDQWTEPALGLRGPESARTRVDFPAPFGPTIATSSPPRGRDPHPAGSPSRRSSPTVEAGSTKVWLEVPPAIRTT